jgi:hypothetical protein
MKQVPIRVRLFAPAFQCLLMMLLASALVNADTIKPSRLATSPRMAPSQSYRLLHNKISAFGNIPAADLFGDSGLAGVRLLGTRTTESEDAEDDNHLRYYAAAASEASSSQGPAHTAPIYRYNPRQASGDQGTVAEAYRLLVLGGGLFGAGGVLKLLTRRKTKDRRYL